ncbi:MAG: cyclic nucleotide-binding domain-containing protein [Lachnospiraceae bacterium]|nr:cyclic nucleotide-binding domain-containing protein [Lachnospiraceae bacterium]
MTEKLFKKGNVIFKEGDLGETFYQVIEGSVAIYSNYGKSDENLLVELGAGKFFGEMAVIEYYPRSATAVAVTDELKVCEISSDEISDYFKSQPDKIMELMKNLSGRVRDLTGDYEEVRDEIQKVNDDNCAKPRESVIDKIRKFVGLYKSSKDSMAEPSDEMVRKQSHSEGFNKEISSYKKGDIIFKEGEDGVCMYDIHFGKVGVYKSYGQEGEKLIKEISTDDFFGEMGLIDNSKRSATAVVMEDETTIEYIYADDFKELFEKNPPKVEMILAHLSYTLRTLTRSYLNACQLLAEVDESVKGGKPLSDELKQRVAKICL